MCRLAGAAYATCTQAVVSMTTRIQLNCIKFNFKKKRKGEGKLLPRQRERLKVWGCAAYYGQRGTIGPAEKLGPRADLCVLVVYDSNGLGYRVAELPSFNVRTALHVTFVENFFPCVTKVGGVYDR